MKTVLVFNFDRYYPGGGANDLRQVLRIENELDPKLIVETMRPLDGDFVNAVVIDDASGERETRRWTVVREATEEGLLQKDVVAGEAAPRWSTDAEPWVGLRPADY